MNRMDLMESMLMDLADAVCALDLEDRILFVNRVGAELLGGTVEDLIGRPQQEVFGKRVYAEAQKQLDERMQGRSSTYELGIFDAAGEERTLLVTGSPLRDPLGQVVGSFGVLKDITERKRREQAMDTRLLLDQAVADSVRTLVRQGSLDEGMDQALGLLGILLNAERVRLYLSHEPDNLICAKEWPPMPAEHSVVGNLLARDRFAWSLEQLRQVGIVYIKEGQALPPEADDEATTMARMGVRSLLAVPLFQAENILGFVSFENPAPYGDVLEGDLTSLMVFGDVLANLLHQLKLDRAF